MVNGWLIHSRLSVARHVRLLFGGLMVNDGCFIDDQLQWLVTTPISRCTMVHLNAHRARAICFGFLVKRSLADPFVFPRCAGMIDTLVSSVAFNKKQLAAFF